MNMLAESNYQREEILPSERAKAYKMKLEAIKRQGGMKSLSKKGLLDADIITEILLEQKKPECWNMVIPMSKITKYFPKSYTPKDMEEIIIDLLGKWARDL